MEKNHNNNKMFPIAFCNLIPGGIQEPPKNRTFSSNSHLISASDVSFSVVDSMPPLGNYHPAKIHSR